MKFLMLDDIIVKADHILKIVPVGAGGSSKTCIVIWDVNGVESKEFTETPFKTVLEAFRSASDPV